MGKKERHRLLPMPLIMISYFSKTILDDILNIGNAFRVYNRKNVTGLTGNVW